MDRSPSRIERLLAPRQARIALLLIGIVSVVFGLALRNARLDFDFEKFFPKDDPELDRYNTFRERFGSDNDFLLVGIPRARGIYERGFLVQVDSLVSRLQKIPYVSSVISPTRLEEPIITPLGAFATPYLRLDNDTLLRIDSARIARDPRIRSAFFAEDGKALLLIVNCEHGLSKVKSDALLANVDAEIATSGLTDVHLAGRVHGQHHYIRMMVHELFLFLGSAILLLSVFLWFGFRSITGVLVPVFTVGLAILWQVGLMTLLGKPLGILTMLLPTILFVVGMSDVVHILECYLDELRAGTPKRRAIANTYREVGLPTLLTAITAGIGFATLGTASIVPLQEFGWYTGIGVLLTFVLAFTLLPALLVFLPERRLLTPRLTTSPWDARLPRLFRWTVRHRTGILVVFGAVTVAGLWGASRIKVDNYLLDDWPEQEQERLGYRFFDRSFGGVRPFELEITVKDSSLTVWDPSVLRDIERVQTEVEQRFAAHSILSPVTLMRSLNKAFNGGQAEYYTLPADSFDTARMAQRATLLGGTNLQTLVSEDGRTARLSGRMVDAGGYLNMQRNTMLEKFIAEHTDRTKVDFHQTGMAFLIDRNNATLSGQLMRGMGLAVLLTALIMMWFFRDWRMVLVALLPNLVPLAFIAGVMGFCGIALKVSTAIIFSIAFGIAEDDTIHMLAKLRQELRTGKHPLYALKRTYLTTGKAVTVTGLMLLSGFVTLMFSDFGSIFHMGLLITLTLAFAFVAELLLLPALLMFFVPERRRK